MFKAIEEIAWRPTFRELIHCYVLSPKEWEVLGDIHKVLKVGVVLLSVHSTSIAG